MRTAAVAALLGLSSCSFAIVRGPPSPIPAGDVQCSVGYAFPIVDSGAGLGAVAAGLGLLAVRERDDSLGAQVPFVFILAGATLIVSAISGFNKVSNCRDAKTAALRGDDRAVREADRLKDRRTRAWALTQEAAQAARDGDCVIVKGLAPKVIELDGEFHATVFLRDVGIARCMAASTNDVVRPTEIMP